LRYLTELAARKQRRTVSSFIEWAIERALERVILRETHDEPGVHGVFLGDQVMALWDTDSRDRLAKLGLHFPELLTYEEQILWKLIRECGAFWQGYYDEKGDWRWEAKEDSLIFQKVREYWDILTQVAAGKADKSTLPKCEEHKPPR
jgi:hypothetical protein